MIYYILFTIFIAWATFVAYGINNLINNKLKYCKNLDTNIMDLHKPFQRTDYHLWDQLEMTLVGTSSNSYEIKIIHNFIL
jgi:hypothetical protein